MQVFHLHSNRQRLTAHVDPGSVSIALGLLPVSVWILLQRSDLEPLPVRSLSLASMVTAGTAAVANVVEDGFGVSVAGTASFAGVVGTLLVLLVAAAGLAVRGPRGPALVPLATVIGNGQSRARRRTPRPNRVGMSRTESPFSPKDGCAKDPAVPEQS